MNTVRIDASAVSAPSALSRMGGDGGSIASSENGSGRNFRPMNEGVGHGMYVHTIEDNCCDTLLCPCFFIEERCCKK